MGDLTALLRPLYGNSDRETGVEAMLAICDPEIEVWPGGLWLDDASVLHGREEVEDFFERLADAFEDLHFECGAVRGARRLRGVQVQLEVRGRLSGIADSRTLGHLWRFRDGRAIEVRAFNDPEAAFKGL